MKRCPNCNQGFGDDDDFCPNDGTVLVVDSVGYQPSGEMPTQYVPRPQSVAAAPAGGSSNMLYLVIGILATALVAVGLYLFLSRDVEKRSETVNSNTTQTSTAPVNTTSATPLTNTVVNNAAPLTPPIESFVSPSGTWQGQWTNRNGAAFGDQLTLRDDGNGRVSGQIIHTLQQTTNPQKLGKIGLTAVEYLQGNYDPKTRMIILSGIRKNDPNDLIILDKYRLSISADNSTVAGETLGGRDGGRISLRR